MKPQRPVVLIMKHRQCACHQTVPAAVCTHNHDARKPGAALQGWEAFTDAAIAALSKRRSHVVFLLWGKPAQTKEKLINQVCAPTTW